MDYDFGEGKGNHNDREWYKKLYTMTEKFACFYVGLFFNCYALIMIESGSKCSPKPVVGFLPLPTYIP